MRRKEKSKVCSFAQNRGNNQKQAIQVLCEYKISSNPNISNRAPQLTYWLKIDCHCDSIAVASDIGVLSCKDTSEYIVICCLRIYPQEKTAAYRRSSRAAIAPNTRVA